MATYVGTNGDNTYAGPIGEVNFINGKSGDDRLTGGFLPDSVLGGDGNDTLFGLQGDDILDGGDGDDRITAGEGDDSIFTGGGSNTVDGGRGDDVFDLRGAAAAAINIAVGGSGDDVFVAGGGSDRLDGGVGVDTVSYAFSGAAVTAFLDTRSYFGGAAQGDRLRGIENIVGSRHNDVLAGDTLNNQLHGGKGNDDMAGRAGADTLIGAAGDDMLAGGAGADELDGGAGIDSVRYDSAEDMTLSIEGSGRGGEAEGDFLFGIERVFCFGAGVETVLGSQSSNYLFADVVYGFAGSDTLAGGRMTGGMGADSFETNNLFQDLWGDWTILDFQDDRDRIDLLDGYDIEDLTIQAVDADADGAVDDVRIYVTAEPHGSTFVLNHDPGVFDASDFI